MSKTQNKERAVLHWRVVEYTLGEHTHTHPHSHIQPDSAWTERTHRYRPRAWKVWNSVGVLCVYCDWVLGSRWRRVSICLHTGVRGNLTVFYKVYGYMCFCVLESQSRCVLGGWGGGWGGTLRNCTNKFLYSCVYRNRTGVEPCGL